MRRALPLLAPLTATFGPTSGAQTVTWNGDAPTNGRFSIRVRDLAVVPPVR